MDASALLKAVFAEPETEALAQWLRKALLDGADLLAPHLLRYELGQRLARAPGLDAAARQDRLERALLGFRFADGRDAFAHAPPLTYYDASYLALAQASGATLVTYDDVLLKAARRARIPTLRPGA